jgi:hypothetical protein
VNTPKKIVLCNNETVKKKTKTKMSSENGIQVQGGDRFGNIATGALLGYAVSGNGRGAAIGGLLGSIAGGRGTRKSKKSKSPHKSNKSLKGKSRSLKGGACPQKCSANRTRNRYSGKFVYGKHQFVENYLQNNGYLNYNRQNGYMCNYCYCVTR